jgi:hypothetical protein
MDPKKKMYRRMEVGKKVGIWAPTGKVTEEGDQF